MPGTKVLHVYWYVQFPGTSRGPLSPNGVMWANEVNVWLLLLSCQTTVIDSEPYSPGMKRSEVASKYSVIVLCVAGN